LPTTFNTIQGRVLNANNTPRANAYVFLIKGENIDPLLFLRGQAGVIQFTVTAADGSYKFSNLLPGKYLIVPTINGIAVRPTGTVVSIPSNSSTDFHAVLSDSIGPEVSITSPDDLPYANATALPAPAGTVRDLNAPRVLPSGTLTVAYTVYRLKSDAASLRLAPRNRGMEAVLSTKALAFASTTSAASLVLDNIFFAPVDGTKWAATPEAWAQVKTALLRDAQARGSRGAYRLVAMGIDNAFNRTEVSSSFSVGNDSVVAPAHLGVTRSLPLTARNGSDIIYSITVSNTGDLPLSNVRVAQNINTDQTVLKSATGSHTVNAYGVLWNLGSIEAHGKRLLQATVTAQSNTPFGTNIRAGDLSGTSSGGTHLFSHDQINIESNLPLIGNLVNIVRSVGDAIGSGLSYVFSSSLRDQRAEANLKTVNSNSIVTRIAGVDALQLNASGVLLIPLGANQVIAIGGGNVITAGGGN